MKAVMFFMTITSIYFCSCKKSDIKPDSNPPVIDSVPIHPNTDTSTLVKMRRAYQFEADGITVMDSTTGRWTYDDKRRIIKYYFEGFGYQDTITYTYLEDQYLCNSFVYFMGSLVMTTSQIFYQHIPGQTDSILTVNTGYGMQAGDDYTGMVYYYYNTRNLDSLEKAYRILNNNLSYSNSVASYYTGSNLDSVVGSDNLGNPTFIKYYSGGDQTYSTSFYNGVMNGKITFTYLDIPSGGLGRFLDASRLMSGYTSVTIPATNTFTESVTYQFDSVERVSVIHRDHHGVSPNQKEVYTYY